PAFARLAPVRADLRDTRRRTGALHLSSASSGGRRPSSGAGCMKPFDHGSMASLPGADRVGAVTLGGTVRILLADDHVLVRAGLRRILESFPGAEVVAECDDGDQVSDLVALHRPDVVVTDLSMQRSSGFDVIRSLKREHPEVHVIVVSMHADPTRVS